LKIDCLKWYENSIQLIVVLKLNPKKPDRMAETDKHTDAATSLQSLLRSLPGVDRMLELAKADPDFSGIPRSVLTAAVRHVIEIHRQRILQNRAEILTQNLTDAYWIEAVKQAAGKAMTPNLVRAINATGIVVHTNLGRSLLAGDALDHIFTVASRYSNLEFNLAEGRRGSRYAAVEDLICELTGAESAMVVNNNAAAVLLSLDTIAKNKEVIVSRGELVEIGGSFRIPDVMAKSGALLKEVGTTNRTHLRDYQRAVTDQTGLLLKVHSSNFALVGFTASVSLKEMVELGAQYGLPVMEDLGSGTLIDFSKYGLMKEPTVCESVSAGVDIVTFSGDKLLGMDKIKQNPLTRALRIDKLTLAGLESTLRLYRDEEKAVNAIPTLRMITCPVAEIQQKARRLKKMIRALKDPRIDAGLLDLPSKAGGGALPLLDLPSKCVSVQIKGMSADALETRMRNHRPPIIGRIMDDTYLMDMRTVFDDELPEIIAALQTCLKEAQINPNVTLL
jgi:L-seryl-tRNA(Ser) seleniumtransferase